MMKDFKTMNFYTTSELAEKLKMNIQVVTRKLQSGEIEGHKIGKDWRIEEEAIQAWLLKISNQQNISVRQKVLNNFIKNDQLTHLPAQRKKRIYVLEYFLEKFDSGWTYDESELNNIIAKHYADFCTVRREFIMEKMMTRKDNRYRRNSSYVFAD
jgi:excisionase family DNA binding protein